MKIRHVLALASTAALLTACGGGSGGEVLPLDPTKVPASATSSSRAYTLYVQGLVATSTETGTPLDVSAVDVAPTSETEVGVTF